MMFVAACGGQGLDIEVHGDMAFDAVELFIAYDTCHDCATASRGPARNRRTAAESVYLLKGDEMVVRTTELDGKSAILHLEASDGFDKTTAIADRRLQGRRVVGIRVLYDKAIPRDDQEKWSVDLTRHLARRHRRHDAAARWRQPPIARSRGRAKRSPTCSRSDRLRELPRLSGVERRRAGRRSSSCPRPTPTATACRPTADPLWAHRPLGTARCVDASDDNRAHERVHRRHEDLRRRIDRANVHADDDRMTCVPARRL